jgi:hypothetical protein
MTATGLNGRVTRLERVIAPPASHQCRSCGLRHVQPLTIALLRGVLRVRGGSDLQEAPPVPLCLCEPCCADGRWIALLSRGVPEEAP